MSHLISQRWWLLNWHSGYTGWIELEDGEFYAVNYICDKAPKAQIRGYCFSAADF